MLWASSESEEEVRKFRRKLENLPVCRLLHKGEVRVNKK